MLLESRSTRVRAASRRLPGLLLLLLLAVYQVDCPCPEVCDERLQQVLITVQPLQGKLATSFEIVDAQLKSYRRNRGFFAVLTITSLGEWEALKQHCLKRERFFVNSSRNSLVHFNDLKLLTLADDAENFK